MYCPPKPLKPKVPDEVKGELSRKAQRLIGEYLRLTHVKPAPKSFTHKYLIGTVIKRRNFS